MPDDLLITAEQLREYSPGEQVGRIHTDQAWAERMIRAAQSALGRFLKYTAFANIRALDVRVPDGYTPGGDAAFWPVGPASSVLDEAGSIDALGRIVFDTSFRVPDSGLVQYVTGWRRELQDAAAIQAIPYLSDLTDEEAQAIPAVPDTVKDALAEAALIKANRVSTGTLGVQEKTQDLGTTTVRVTRTVEDAMDEVFEMHLETQIKDRPLA